MRAIWCCPIELMKEDKELQEFRDLLKPPTHFEEGFDWKTVVGAVFIGFLIVGERV